MPRFFVPKELLPIISGQDAHQIRDVLRLKTGDELELLDGAGKIYRAKIAEIKKDKVTTELLSSKQAATNQKVKVTIAQCLPKAKKMSLIIQKCTELGAASIIPTLSERSIAKNEKLERWQKIAKEAAEQSGQAIMPEITGLKSLADVLKLKSNYDLALIPWELEETTTLKSILTTHIPSLSIIVLIGSEGGFSKEEVTKAIEAGFTSITLGKRILRAETAGLSILSMINYHFDQ